MSLLSVIVPCYNEEENVDCFYEELMKNSLFFEQEHLDVEIIYVDAPDKTSGKRRQHIHIQYDGLGFIPLNELLTSEKA